MKKRQVKNTDLEVENRWPKKYHVLAKDNKNFGGESFEEKFKRQRAHLQIHSGRKIGIDILSVLKKT